MNNGLYDLLDTEQQHEELVEDCMRNVALKRDNNTLATIDPTGCIVWVDVTAPIRPTEKLDGAHRVVERTLDEGTYRKARRYDDNDSNMRNSAHHKSWKTSRRKAQTWAFVAKADRITR